MPDGPLTASERARAVETIAGTPENVRRAVAGLSEEQLDSPYRPGGWTVRQVVHHLPESHMNSYIRLKLAITEDEPTIRTYDEARWAETPDARGPIDMSLDLLEAVHKRYVYLWRRLSDSDWLRQFNHPDFGLMPVYALVAMYAWHGDHHVAHITRLRDREGW